MKNKLIYIEWEDACSNDKWMDEAEAEHWAHAERYLVKQVGFVWREDKKHIVLFGGVYDSGEFMNQYHNFIKIPKSWIRKRINLTKYIK